MKYAWRQSGLVIIDHWTEFFAEGTNGATVTIITIRASFHISSQYILQMYGFEPIVDSEVHLRASETQLCMYVLHKSAVEQWIINRDI